jgi:hypothetical protein
MRCLRPIPEPQVTEPELLQDNKNDIVGNTILHCGKLMDMFQQILQGTWSKWTQMWTFMQLEYKQSSKVGIVMASRIKMW